MPAMEALAAPLPGQFPRWQPWVSLLVALHSFLKRTERMKPAVRGVEAANLLRQISENLARLNLAPPALGHQPEEAWDKLTGWAVEHVRSLAA